MKKYLLLVGLLPCAGFVHAEGETDYPSVKNAAAIVDAIRSKAELKAIGVDRLATDAEIDALEKLGDCEPIQIGEIEENLALFDWNCEGASSTKGDVSLQLRFRDDGSLFALALNPLKANFAPTEAGMQFADWPSRKKTAERFVDAVISGEDPTLGQLVPLTSLQVTHLQAFAGGEGNVVRYMTEREKRVARRQLGRDVKFAEAPDNAIDLRLAAKNSSETKGKKVSIYFDDGDRVIGVQMEEDLTRVSVSAVPIGAR